MVHCYEAEAKVIASEEEGEEGALEGLELEETEDGGVPMEHLIACIKGLQVRKKFFGVLCSCL